MDINVDLPQWFTDFLIKSLPAGSGVNTHANNEHPLDLATQQLEEELCKPII